MFKSKPLKGLKVVDLTRVQQGPQATGMLCDMGADVIKVEDPKTGDGGRFAGLVDPEHGYGTLYLIHNRGKRDIVVDLKTSEGREVIYRLVAEADVIANNFRVGVMDRLGLGYDALRAINPKIVYAEANGLGSAGPRAKLPVYDLLGQAASGLVSINGPDSDPVQVGAYVADAGGAIMFASAILAGVVAAKLSGEAQRVEVSELGSMMALQGWELTYFHQKGDYAHQRAGTNTPRKLVSGVFKTADGHLALSNFGRKADWPTLTQALDVEHLAQDERFFALRGKSEHAEELFDHLKVAFEKRTTDEWMERLVPLEVCLHPVLTYQQVMNDPQAIANGYVVDIDHPIRGRIRTTGFPIKFDGQPLDLPPTCPAQGEHTDEVLCEYGYSAEQISALKSSGVVRQAEV